MSSHTYSQTAGGYTGTTQQSFFQDVAISPATVKDGTLKSRLDQHIYPKKGVYIDENRGVPTVSLVTSSATPPTNMSFDLTATVTFAGHVGRDTVSFYEGGTNLLGTAKVKADGTAKLTVSGGLSAAAHTITAKCGGTTSSGVTVTPANPTVALATSNATPVHATAFDLTATITFSDVAYHSTGNVVFKDGSTVIGTVALDGVAHISTAVLHVTAGVTTGAHTMTAVFDGVTSSGVTVTAS